MHSYNILTRKCTHSVVEILKDLDHPNIVRCLETYSYKLRWYILLELCSGGDLYTRDPYTEAEAQAMVRSLLEALAYLHARQIVHRDLKFENVYVDARVFVYLRPPISPTIVCMTACLSIRDPTISS